MWKLKKLGIELNVNSMILLNNTCKRKKIYDVIQFILLYCITYSTLNCFSSGIRLPIQMEKINVIVFFFCMISFITIKYIKAYRIVSVIVWGMAAIICFFWREIIIDGIKVIFNSFLVLYNQYYCVNSIPFQLMTDDIEEAITAAMMVLAFLLSFLNAGFLIKVKRSSYLIIVSLPFVFCSYTVGMLPALISFFIYCCSAVAVLVTCTGAKNHYLKKKGSKREHELNSSMIEIKQGGIVFLIIAIFLVIMTAFLSEERYAGIDFSETKKSLQMELKKISTGEVFKGTIFESMWGEKKLLSRGGLSNGVIGNTKGVTFHNTTELKVTTDGVPTNETIYLRGFIGQQYSQNKWDSLSGKSQKEFSNLKDEYSIDTVDSVNTSLSYLILLWSGQANHIQNIGVQNVGEAKEYFYVPYNQTEDAFIDSNGFLQVPYSDASELITYTCEKLFMEEQRLELYAQVKEQNETNIRLIEAWLGCSIDEYNTGHISQTAEEYMDRILAVSYPKSGRIQVEGLNDGPNEKKPYLLTKEAYVHTYKDFIESTIQIRNEFNFIEEYETFVYENYLELPDHQLESMKTLVDGWKKKEEKNQTDDFYDKSIVKIKEYFKEHTSYTLTPGEVPEGKEVVDYFLFENPNGYCMYYATAAAVMLREFGIPARYVEGFVVTEKDFIDGVYDRGELISSIKDSNAHAWVEVYKKGAGWVPIEVTPAYESNGVVRIPSENKKATLQMNPLKTTQNRPPVTKAPTKAPSVTVKPQSQTTTQKAPVVEIAGGKGTKSIVQITLYILIGFVFLFIVTSILIRITIDQRRRKMTKVENTSKKAILQYRVLQKLFLNRKIVYRDKEPFTVYAKEIQEKFPCFTEEECQKYIYLILKARYHYGWLTKEEGEFTTLFYEKIIQEFYQNVSKYKRLYYRYVKFF